MTVLPNPSQQVAHESSRRLRYGIIAFAAGVLVVISLLIQQVGYHNTLTEETVQLLVIHRRFPLDIIGAVADAFGLLLTGAVLWWLNGVSLARDRQLSPMTRWLVLVGAPLMAVLEVVTIVIYSIKANSFVHGGNLGYPEAYRLIHPISAVLETISLLEELGALLLAVGFIWTAINAMRVGLLPRVLGYAGVLAGALVIFAIGPISFVIQGVWLVSAAVLISGRWPDEPPAWAEGLAIPWMAGGKPNFEAAGQPTTRRGTRAGKPGPRGRPDPAVATPTAPAGAPNGVATGDYTPRRKKKKR